MPPAITVCILACDEESKIGHALASARACDWVREILVFDSGSSDRTVAIAREQADRVEHHDWVDFTSNRRALVEAATHDWVFVLDADEEISPELAAEIAALKDAAFDAHPLFTMPRRNYLLGRHVKAWDPDRIDRLFHRARVDWPRRSVHDTRIPKDGSPHALKQPILHNRHANDFGDYFDGPRYAARAEALAREMYDAGRRVSYLGLCLRPCVAFIKMFLLKGGFTQGTFGLAIAQKAAFSVQLKYARLWHLQQTKGHG